MKARAITVAALGGALLFGCASVLGIKDLPSDGSEDGGGSSGASGSGSGSGGASGSSGTSGASGSGSGSGGTTTSGGSSSSGSSGASGSGSSGSGRGSSGASSGDAATCTPPAGAACQIDPPCGCPSNEKCSYTSTCVPAGSVQSGGLCTGESDCAAGLTCAASVCKPYCNDAASACPAASSGPPLGLCVQIDDDTTEQPIPQDEYCLLDCTPSPNNCGAGQTCDIVTLDSVSYGNCVAAGTLAAGQPCTATTDCVAGTVCFDTSSGDLCAQPCRSTSDCANLSGTSCDFAMGGTVEGVQYGVCFD